MAIEQDWDKSDLRDILMQDNWFPLFAFWTIAGIYLERDDPPDEYFTYLGYVEEEACSPAWFRGRDEREHIVERLQKIWSANSYDIPKPPEFFIKWAIQRDQPPEWLGWAKEKMLYIPEESTDTQGKIKGEKPAESTRKYDNLLRALTCISIDVYGYDPKAEKSTAPADIQEILATHGFVVDQKTVRGWLKDGANLLELSSKKKST